MAEFIVPNFKFESLSKKLNTIANKCKKAENRYCYNTQYLLDMIKHYGKVNYPLAKDSVL